MALPAILAVPDADVQVVRWLAPILELAPGFAPRAAHRDPEHTTRRVLPLDRGRAGFVRAVRTLRARRYERGILLTPSFSSALIFLAGGVRQRRGLASDARSALLHDPVRPDTVSELHRSTLYHHLVTGRMLQEHLEPRLEVPNTARERWIALLRGQPSASHQTTQRSTSLEPIDSCSDGPLIGLFPGSNASSRRWAADRFAALVQALQGRGVRVVVFGGAGERGLAAEVAGAEAVNMAGRTDLPTLAAGLEDCSLLVTNDSGPMHLAAAVGTPTVSLWGAGDPTVTGPLGPAGHTRLQREDLPCVPCVRNRCPRRGPGYVLAEAERECLQLIEVSEVLDAIEMRLTEIGTAG